MKELYLVRHAKSSWDNNTLNDFERPLNERGRKDAPLMGKMIKPLLKKPDVVYSSAATRAITTALAICFEIDFPASKIEIEYALYVASEQKVINKILSLNDALNNVMLVGHNEWMEDVANYFKANFGHMPTGGCLGLRFNCDSWTQASRENCTLAFFEFPKKYLSNLKIDRKPDDL